MASNDPAKNAKKQQPNSTEKKGKPANNNNGAPPSEIATLINAIANDGEANREQKRRHDRGHRFREWITIFIVFIASAAGITQAWIFNRQLGEMISASNQAERAISAFKVMADGFPQGLEIFRDYIDFVKKSSRDTQPVVLEVKKPAISISATSNGGLSFSYSHGVVARVFFVVRNDGQLDTKVSVAANLIMQTDIRAPNVVGDQNVACREAHAKDGKEVKAFGGAISDNIALGVKADEFIRGVRSATETKNLIFLPIVETTNYIAPIIVGCVEYGAEKDRRQIKFIGNIIRTSPKENRLVVTPNGGTITSDELAIDIVVTSSS
jgi:hypothetical protein